jgi:calcineurin-like phosphoesterase family protein
MSIYNKAMAQFELDQKPRVFLTSDQHFGHLNIIKYCNRPFKSVEEMNEAIITAHNKVVKPRDIVYHLGDFSMSFKDVEPVLSRLSGTKILIMGNHDSCSPLFRHRGRVTITDYVNAGFRDVYNELLIDDVDTGIKLRLHHLPYEADIPGNTDRRYLSSRPRDDGVILLHGHVHNSWRISSNRRMFNVGVDTSPGYAPWNISDIMLQLNLVNSHKVKG